jgi:hypothetical protein
MLCVRPYGTLRRAHAVHDSGLTVENTLIR